MMPRSHGLLRLYSDTSKVAAGGSLWQVQDGQERLIAYHSKALPSCAARYGVSELELTGLYLNIFSIVTVMTHRSKTGEQMLVILQVPAPVSLLSIFPLFTNIPDR